MKMVDDLKSKLKKIKVEHLIIVCALIAVGSIFLSTIDFSSNSQASSVEEYVALLEKKLSNKLSNVEGAGKVEVLLSVDSAGRTEIAMEKKTTSDSSGIKFEESPILVSGKPIVLSEHYPAIVGVIILAQGADDIKVRMALMNATQTFLNITSDKIEILLMR